MLCCILVTGAFRSVAFEALFTHTHTHTHRERERERERENLLKGISSKSGRPPDVWRDICLTKRVTFS